MPETFLTCKSCKNKVPLSDLKADKSGSGWVCLECYKHQHPEIYKPEIKKQPSKTKVSELTPSRLINYYCSECGYKFKKEPNFQGKCPYCDLYSVKEEKDANTLIRDSIDHIDLNPKKESTETKKDNYGIEIIDD